MYVALFNLAGIAMLGWLLLILLPAWKVTRWIARTAAFPVFLSVVYVLGIVPLLMRTGPGIMGDFGSAEGVTAAAGEPGHRAGGVDPHPGVRPGGGDDDLPGEHGAPVRAAARAVGAAVRHADVRPRGIPELLPAARLEPQPPRRSTRSRRRRSPSSGRVAAAEGIGAAVRTAAAGSLGVFRREWLLTATAVLGLLLGAACAVAIGVRGTELVGDGGAPAQGDGVRRRLRHLPAHAGDAGAARAASRAAGSGAGACRWRC